MKKRLGSVLYERLYLGVSANSGHSLCCIVLKWSIDILSDMFGEVRRYISSAFVIADINCVQI